MENVTLKKIGIDEVLLLQQVARQTFTETFAGSNTESDMAAYLSHQLSAATLLEALRNTHSLFYFAMLKDRVAGYLKLNTGAAQTELREDGALEIERIYVLQEYYGSGIGQLLYEQALQEAEELQADYIWLGVWEHNHRAIRFYEKNGFVPFDHHIFRLGNDEQTDILMRKPLK